MSIQETKSGETGQRYTGQRTEVNGVETGKFFTTMNIFLYQEVEHTSMQGLSLKYKVSGVDFIVFG